MPRPEQPETPRAQAARAEAIGLLLVVVALLLWIVVRGHLPWGAR